MLPWLMRKLKGNCLHPQWLSDRYHAASRKALGEVRQGMVLDIGSGDSDHGSLLAEGCTLIRLDYPATNRRYRRRPDVYGDARCLPVVSSGVDTVLLLEVIEHVPEYARILLECRRVLKPGGRIHLSVPFLYPIHDAPHDYHRFTRYGLCHELESAGFRVLELIQHGNSFVTALQMMNMAWLEVARQALSRNHAVGLVVAVVVYPLCLLNNLLALPLLGIRGRSAAALGYYVVAEPDGS